MRSWRKKANIMLTAILVVAMGLLLWSNWYYNREIRQTVLEENTNALSLWTQRVDSSLGAAYERVLGMMLMMSNSMEVRSGSPAIPLQVRADLLDKMEETLLTSSYIDCFFVLDCDTEALLISMNGSLDYEERSALRGMISRLDAEDVDPVRDRTWSVVRSESGHAYFLKTLQLGKYAVGAACKVMNFDIMRTVGLFGEKTSCLLIGDDGVYFCGGDMDRSGEIRFDSQGEPYFGGAAVTIQGLFEGTDVVAVLSVETDSLFDSRQLWVALLLAVSSVFFVLLILAFVRMMRREIAVPTRELLHASNEIGAGNIQYRITEPAENEEFHTLFTSFNAMADQIFRLRIESYDRLLADRENQLRLLRAQVKPHFYLNAITSISSMTYLGRNEDVRAFCQALAKYMRYMLNVQSNWTTVGEELTHIGNYVDMQKLRLSGNVELCVECPEELKATRIPIMVLFTIVENAFKHALNPRKQLHVRIRVGHMDESEFTGCRIRVEDNGEGFPGEQLDVLNTPLDGTLPAKEHLGLSNVRYTLSLSYGRDGLFGVWNKAAGGAVVELRIPEEPGERMVDE